MVNQISIELRHNAIHQRTRHQGSSHLEDGARVSRIDRTLILPKMTVRYSPCTLCASCTGVSSSVGGIVESGSVGASMKGVSG